MKSRQFHLFDSFPCRQHEEFLTRNFVLFDSVSLSVARGILAHAPYWWNLIFSVALHRYFPISSSPTLAVTIERTLLVVIEKGTRKIPGQSLHIVHNNSIQTLRVFHSVLQITQCGGVLLTTKVEFINQIIPFELPNTHIPPFSSIPGFLLQFGQGARPPPVHLKNI